MNGRLRWSGRTGGVGVARSRPSAQLALCDASAGDRALAWLLRASIGIGVPCSIVISTISGAMLVAEPHKLTDPASSVALFEGSHPFATMPFEPTLDLDITHLVPREPAARITQHHGLDLHDACTHSSERWPASSIRLRSIFESACRASARTGKTAVLQCRGGARLVRLAKVASRDAVLDIGST